MHDSKQLMMVDPNYDDECRALTSVRIRKRSHRIASTASRELPTWRAQNVPTLVLPSSVSTWRVTRGRSFSSSIETAHGHSLLPSSSHHTTPEPTHKCHCYSALHSSVTSFTHSSTNNNNNDALFCTCLVGSLVSVCRECRRGMRGCVRKHWRRAGPLCFSLDTLPCVTLCFVTHLFPILSLFFHNDVASSVCQGHGRCEEQYEQG